jgi:DNA-binding CsgD family transcriptional regulator
VARRLTGSFVGFLGATRTGEDDFFEHVGLPALTVQPLDAVAAGELLDYRFPSIPSGVRQGVLAEAQGNPLALLELPISSELTALGPPERRSRGKLNDLFAARLFPLSDDARSLLLLASLEASGDLGVLETACTTSSGLADLHGAVEARLISVDAYSNRIAFRHPLIRAAVVSTATDESIRDAHRALAVAVTDSPDRRAWHLAKATIEPDEGVACLLEDTAHRTLRRGDASETVAALIRSAELTPDQVARGRRLAEAAYIGSNLTGVLSDASALLTEARQAALDEAGSLYAASAATFIMVNGDGDVETAHRLLVAAIDAHLEGGEIDRAALEEALHALHLMCYMAGSSDMWARFFERLDRFPPPLPETLYLIANIFADPCRAQPDALARLDQAIQGLGEADSVTCLRIANAAVFADRLSKCREALWRVVREGRAGGVVPLAISALALLSTYCMQSGRWDEAVELQTEGLELARRLGYGLLAWFPLQVSAMTAAWRGDQERAREFATEMMQWATPRRVRTVHTFWNMALHALALGEGDFETAYQRACALTPAGELTPYVSAATYTLMGLVEAAMRTGRRAEAEAHVRAMEEVDVQAVGPKLALLVAGSQAMVAPEERTVELYERALGLPDADKYPFDLARVHLAYGEALRRNRAITEARGELSEAKAIFDALKATPWSARADAELRAAGVGVRRSTSRGRSSDELTVQERQVASLAATGLTNKEISEQLFMSPRTVESHLYRAYPKLGITSRAALRDALVALDDDFQG